MNSVPQETKNGSTDFNAPAWIAGSGDFDTRNMRLALLEYARREEEKRARGENYPPSSNTGVLNTASDFGGENLARLRDLGRGERPKDCDRVIIPHDLQITRMADRDVEIVESPMSDGVRLDWLAFTIPLSVIQSFMTDMKPEDDDMGVFCILRGIGLEVETVTSKGHGAMGYDHAFEIDGIPGALFCIGGESQRGTAHVSLSASALQFYVGVRGLSWQGWLKYLHDLGVKVTRQDFAFDDFSGNVTYERVIDAVRGDSLVSRYRNNPLVYGDKPIGGETFTVYWGIAKGSSKGGKRNNSDTLTRIYDKASESGADVSHWVRVELESHGDRCQEIFKQWVASDFSAAYLIGVLVNTLDFRIPDEDDSNRSRWGRAAWWRDFIGIVGAVSVSIKAKLRTAGDSMRWLDSQCATSIAIVAEVFGEGALKILLEDGRERLNSRHRAIIEASR